MTDNHPVPEAQKSQPMGSSPLASLLARLNATDKPPRTDNAFGKRCHNHVRGWKRIAKDRRKAAQLEKLVKARIRAQIAA